MFFLCHISPLSREVPRAKIKPLHLPEPIQLTSVLFRSNNLSSVSLVMMEVFQELPLQDQEAWVPRSAVLGS